MKAKAKPTKKDFDNLITYLERFKGASVTIVIDKNTPLSDANYIKERIASSKHIDRVAER